MQYRHGDILIQSVDSIPNAAKEVAGGTLAEGEATGHAHTLVKGRLFMRGEDLFFSSAEDTSVVHQEHAKIDIPAGNYRVIRQREYVPMDDPRNVMD